MQEGKIADALIAATAIEHGLDLLTGNSRHYILIKNPSLRSFRPSQTGKTQR